MSVDRPANRSRRGGRPPKYQTPSRPVTVTLPESTLSGLASIDPDRGRAIVKLTDWALAGSGGIRPLVEVVEMLDGTGLIVVGPSQALRRIPFLHLIEVSPTRYLLALDRGNDFRSLEIAVNDILAELAQEETRERELLTQLLEHIRRLRRSARVSMAEILFVRLEERLNPAPGGGA